MAKQRDYKKESARRKELANERGFSSYWKMRRAIETGKAPAINSARISNAKTYKAQKDAGYPLEVKASGLFDRVRNSVSRERQCQTWSDLFAQVDEVKFQPDQAKDLGMSKAGYIQRYYRTFVDGRNSYGKVRYKGGSENLREWLVDIQGYIEAKEYDAKYSIS